MKSPTREKQSQSGLLVCLSEPAPCGVDQMLSEISGYLSYFEDLARTDISNIASYEKSIKE